MCTQELFVKGNVDGKWNQVKAPKGTVWCGDCGQAYQGKEAKRNCQKHVKKVHGKRQKVGK